MNTNILIYDLEIINAVPDKRDPMQEGINYCKGWEDHAGMGISVIGAYHSKTQRYRVFLKDNFSEFFQLIEQEDPLLVSFNGIGFDNRVIHACLAKDLSERDHYDVLAELWAGVGLSKKFTYPTHIGFSLDATSQANFGGSKTGNGALAPVDWQRGNIGTVIDYCLNDIRLTKRLLERIMFTGGLRDPRDKSQFIEMAKPKLL